MKLKKNIHLSRLFTIVVYGLLLVSVGCVPNKRLVYLQHQNDLKETSPVDTALRSYDLHYEQYKLQPADIVSIRVASVTGNEYNFINRYQTELGIIRKLNQYNSTGGGNQLNQSGFNNNRNILQGGMGGANGNQEGGISPLALDQLNTGFVLDIEGKLNLPQIGEIQLSGLTIPEAEHKIREALVGYYETPMVRLQLLNFHFTIFGEVESEGRYTSFDPDITVFDAFALAGNLSEFADRSNIKVIRSDGLGKKKVIYLNTLDEQLLTAQHFYLQRGDLIIVPPLEARTANKYTVPNLSRTLGFVSAALSVLAIIITLNK